MKESPKIRCLIIQLATLGDTLQSLMALRAAQQLYPQLEIHFVARERFAHAAKRVSWLSEVIAFPSDEILGPVLSGQETEREALRKLAGWIRPLVQEPWDMLLNWSYSEASSYLAGIVPARIKLGYSRSNDTTLSCPDGWSHYIQAVVQGGIHQNIHLTDVLTTQLLTALQIHFGDPAENDDAPVTSKIFFNIPVPTPGEADLGPHWGERTRKWIAVQPGRGSRGWARLIPKILANHPDSGVILMGSGDGESEHQTMIDSVREALQSDGIRNAAFVALPRDVGFDLWATCIGRAQWLITSDNSAVHLASVLGTRVLNVSFGSPCWNETGPYGNGHYVMASNLACGGCDSPDSEEAHKCQEYLSPELIYSTWTYAMQDAVFRRQLTFGEHLTRNGLGEKLGAVRAFRSRIRASSDGGGVVYEPISPHTLRIDDWTAMVMGHVARSWYCGWVPGVGHELPRSSITPALIQSLRALQESADVLTKICDEAARTASHLNRRSAKLKSQKIMPVKDRTEFERIAQKLNDLDALIERMGRTQTPLAAFSRMSKVLLGNLKGTRLSDLGRETAECYRQLTEGVAILREWIRFTMNLARPVAIRNEPLALVVGRSAKASPSPSPDSPGDA